jgi:exopolyphosphatase / guanosine-5'-triphosphate,3'-diphosphate pyrophosphatase
MRSMQVAVVDVGSNTVQLLVAQARGNRLETVRRRRAYLELGADIELNGWISEAKLRETLLCVRDFVQTARELGSGRIEVVVAAPGRQSANGEELVAALRHTCGAPVRALSADEEARLAYFGAVSALPRMPKSVAVVDVGGGSTEVVVGTTDDGPVWLRSFDLGSLRPLRSLLDGDPPRRAAVADACAEVERRLAGLTPPLPKAALATGGSARALRKLAGRRLGPGELDAAVRKLSKSRADEIVAHFGVDERRARTLLGGALILAEIQRRLGVPLQVSRAGMREAVARSLLAEVAAA